MWARLEADGGFRTVELRDHHEDISKLTLHAGVPEEIAVLFETARNLYLYAWLVYRFYPVAEQQSFACLELALRDRFKEEIGAGKVGSPNRRPMFRALLKYAIAQGVVKNEGFQIWHKKGELNALARVQMQKLREMEEKNLAEITWADSDIQVTDEDLRWDYTSVLAEVLPNIRNQYAHGSTNLHNLALGTIQIVREIINQLYPEKLTTTQSELQKAPAF